MTKAKDINMFMREYTQKWLNNPNNPNYWLDFSSATPNGDGTFTIICTCVKMPYDRVIEMFCDFVAAGKAYEKGKWTPKNPYNYWLEKCKNQRAMHVDSEHLLETLLKKLSDLNGLDKFVAWYTQEKEKLTNQYENLLTLAGKINTEKMNEPSFMMVLTGTGDFAYRRKDGVYVVPIGCLKD